MGEEKTMNIEALLQKHDWNLFFANFPNFEDGKPYRIYKSHRCDQNELLGCGKTPEEAIQMAAAEPEGEGAADERTSDPNESDSPNSNT